MQLGQLAMTVSEREKGKLSSQPEANPRIQNNQWPQQGAQINQLNIIHTLRSGKQIDNHVGISEDQDDPLSKPPHAQVIDQIEFKDPDKSKKSIEINNPPKPLEESTSGIKQFETSPINPVASFSNRLRSNRHSAHIDQILEIFK